MKKLKISILLGAIAVLLSNTTFAQSLTKSENESSLKVKFIGSDDDYLTFQVDIKVMQNNLARIKISDKVEGELYTQSFNKKSPFLIFKIEKQLGQELIFNLFDGNKVITKSFTTTKKVEETITVKENDVAVL
jgi:hypothetical protein